MGIVQPVEHEMDKFILCMRGIVTLHNPFQIFSPLKISLEWLKLETSNLYNGLPCEVLTFELTKFLMCAGS